MESEDLQQYSDILIDFLEPLVRATESPANARALLLEIGYEPPSDVTAFDELAIMLDDVFDIISSIDQLVEINSNDSAQKLRVVTELAIKAGNSIKHINSFSSKIQDNFSGSAILSDTDILSNLPVKIVDLLFISYLEKKLPLVHSLLLFLEIIEQEIVDSTNVFNTFHIARKVKWDKLPQMFTDPMACIHDAFIDGDEIKFNKLIFLLEQIGISIGVFSEVRNFNDEKLLAFNPGINTQLVDFDEIKALRFPLVSDPFAKLAIELYPILNNSNLKTQGVGAGLIFGSQLEFPIGDNFKLEIEVSSFLQDSLGIKIDKDGNFSFVNKIFASPQTLADSVQFGFKASFEAVDTVSNGKYLKISFPDDSKFEIGKAGFVLGIDKGRDDVSFYIELDIKDVLIDINLGGADSFIGSIFPESNITSNFNLGIGFSNNGGIYFKGGSLEIALPMHLQLGPIEILQIALGLKVLEEKLNISAAASFNAVLGPLQVVVENVGIQTDIIIVSDKNGNAGPLNFSPAFKPPNGVGLAINAGAVTGGGYLFFDYEKEEYAGALELTIANFISAKAIGLITTKMPDGSKGFSMLIIITAEFMPPFQLGYGFTLVAVGGLMGLNRTVLLEPLRDGVRTGAVNNIMFPQNVIANAPRIISDLKTIFPPYEGKFLIAPIAKIGWGTPTLINLSMGIIIEIPGNIAILGVLRVILPDERATIVKMQVAFVGTIDFNKKLLTFDASLFESRVLTMPLEGDMAVRLKWGDNPDFILTVGGFHPAYTPPPLALPTMRRLSLNILNTSISHIRVECYQAITSNTVQFGAKAEVSFDLSACSIKGFISFDALFQFSPFYFVIAVTAKFSLKAAGLDLLSVRVRMSLEGPTPWRAKGTGSVSLLFYEISADFDVTWGETRNTTLPDIEILPRFIEELNKREQWSTALSTDKNLLVTLRKIDETTTSHPLVLHPAGSLVVHQKLLPLMVKIDKVGNQKTSDIQKVAITGALSHGSTLNVDFVDESFARAQYQNLIDAEKLSKPSFEKMPGGVKVSMGNAIKNGKMVRRKIEYEVIIVDKEPTAVTKLFILPILLFTHFLKGNSISKSVLSRGCAEKMKPFQDKISVAEEGFTVAFQADNKAFDGKATFASEVMAHTYMHEQISKNPALKNELHIIPNYEVHAA